MEKSINSKKSDSNKSKEKKLSISSQLKFGPKMDKKKSSVTSSQLKLERKQLVEENKNSLVSTQSKLEPKVDEKEKSITSSQLKLKLKQLLEQNKSSLISTQLKPEPKIDEKKKSITSSILKLEPKKIVDEKTLSQLKMDSKQSIDKNKNSLISTQPKSESEQTSEKERKTLTVSQYTLDSKLADKQTSSEHINVTKESQTPESLTEDDSITGMGSHIKIEKIKINAEQQTIFSVTPHFTKKFNITLVKDSGVVQTEVSWPPDRSDTELYKIIQARIDAEYASQ